jgi:hypothetical protein
LGLICDLGGSSLLALRIIAASVDQYLQDF